MGKFTWHSAFKILLAVVFHWACRLSNLRSFLWLLKLLLTKNIERRLVAVILLYILSSTSYLQAQQTPSIQGRDYLKNRGLEFRKEVEKQYLQREKMEGYKRVYDLGKKFCGNYFPQGMLLNDAETILIAAGAHRRESSQTVFVPAFNHRSPNDSTDRGDVAAGISLYRSYVSRSAFSIIFRPQKTTGSTDKINSIVSCAIISVSL